MLFITGKKLLVEMEQKAVEEAETQIEQKKGENGKYIVGIIIDGERKILVFSGDGTFLFERGQCSVQYKMTGAVFKLPC